METSLYIAVFLHLCFVLQIKVLQQLLQQNSLAMTKGHSSLALQYSVQITKAKQQITALQVSFRKTNCDHSTFKIGFAVV